MLTTYVPASAPAGPSAPAVTTYVPAKPVETKTSILDLSPEPRRLITEGDVLSAAKDGNAFIRFGKDAIITPLARDAAAARGIELIELA